MKVTPFTRDLKDRKRIWLRIYIKSGDRREEPTNLYLTGNKAKDKEAMRFAELHAKEIERNIIANDLTFIPTKKNTIDAKKYLKIYLNSYTKKDKRMKVKPMLMMLFQKREVLRQG